MIYEFTIPGKLWGYRQGRKEAFRPERVAFKETVRLLASIAGVPDEQPERPGYVNLDVHLFWKKRARIDAVNVLKLIEDALWSRDRRTNVSVWFEEDAGEESADVKIEYVSKTCPGCRACAVGADCESVEGK